MPELRIRRKARIDTAAAYDWLEASRAGLGDRFLNLLDECYAALIANPYQYAKEYLEFRGVQVRPFKYIVYYRLTDDVVVIYRIVHASQDRDRVMTEGVAADE
jgi:plasmid stabilization system protein ParE